MLLIDFQCLALGYAFRIFSNNAAGFRICIMRVRLFSSIFDAAL
jgi:hypothetical protein